MLYYTTCIFISQLQRGSLFASLLTMYGNTACVCTFHTKIQWCETKPLHKLEHELDREEDQKLWPRLSRKGGGSRFANSRSLDRVRSMLLASKISIDSRLRRTTFCLAIHSGSTNEVLSKSKESGRLLFHWINRRSISRHLLDLSTKDFGSSDW